MSPGSPEPQLKPPSLHRGVTGPESGWGADCSSSHCPLLASCPLLTPLMRLDLAPCGTLASCPPGASAGPGALAAVPATHQNHKQTLLPRNTASPQHSRAGGIMGPEPEALAGHHRLCNPFISQTGRLRLTESASVLLSSRRSLPLISCTAELVSSLPSVVSAPSWAHKLLKERCSLQL